MRRETRTFCGHAKAVARVKKKKTNAFLFIETCKALADVLS